jgi:uncharacterized protein
MQPSFPYRIKEQQLWLSCDRTLFWEEEKALIVSDLHFGKTGHFRKSGLAVPQALYRNDLQRLLVQIQYFQPDKLIIVGDLFHSEANKEMELFIRWMDNFPDLELNLIKGNHDILVGGWYEKAGITVSDKDLVIGGFHFVHDISGSEAKKAHYSFSGHIHPGIRVQGAGKQSLCFPCFYFAEAYAVIPAFSHFTGVALIEPKKHEHVFAILRPDQRSGQKGRVIQIQ